MTNLRRSVCLLALTVVLLTAVLLTATSKLSAQTIGPCPIFPQNNPWNERIDTLPVHWNSDKYINSVGATRHLHPDFGSDPSYGIPWIAVGSSQPFVTVNITGYVDESDPGPMPIPANAPVEQPAPPSGDGHVLVVDTGNCKLYELYQGIKGSGSDWSATSTAIFDLTTNKFRPDGWTSCDAAGLPIWPGLVKKFECDAGEIKHAIRFTVPQSQAGWIFPARHKASSITDTTYMPMGLRLRLKANFDDSHFTGYAKVISTAMKRYGIIMADNGSAWFISGETNTSWPDNDIGQLKVITGGDFEAVYTGPVATHANQFPTPNLGGLVGPAMIRDTAFVGGAIPSTVRITNSGTSPATLMGVRLSKGDAFQMSALRDPLVLSPNDSIDLPLTFAPRSSGVFFDTLVINPNDASPTVVLLFGYATPGLSSEEFLDFGKVVVGNTSTKTFTIKNAGTLSIVLDSLIIDRANSSFTVLGVEPSRPLPIAIPKGGSVIVDVRYNPVKVIGDTSTLRIDFLDPNGAHYTTMTTLFGEGVLQSAVASSEVQPLNISVAPNPSHGQFVLKVSISEPVAAALVKVVDMNGKSVYSREMSAGEHVIDLSSLPGGSYLLKLSTSGHEITRAIEIRR